MKLLIAKSLRHIAGLQHPAYGRLVGPRDCANLQATTDAGLVWAADNDAFSSWDAGRYRAMVQRIGESAGCWWCTVPDVVGDARATLLRWLRWRSLLLHAGVPAAFVAQDGVAEIPWDEADAVFLGGTTMFKLGPVAARVAREAQERGLPVHMGRVNSRRRLEYAAALGCASVDGTGLSKYTQVHGWWHAAWADSGQTMLL